MFFFLQQLSYQQTRNCLNSMIIEQTSSSNSDYQNNHNNNLRICLNERKIQQFYQSLEKLKKFVEQTNNLTLSQNEQLQKYLGKFQKPSNTNKNFESNKDIIQLSTQRIERQNYNQLRMIKNQKVRKNWSVNDRIILDWVTIHLSILKNYQNVEKQFIKQDWKFVASVIPGSNANSCMFKWMSLHKTSLNESNWSQEESNILRSLVQKYVHVNKSIQWKDVCKKLYLMNQNSLKNYRTHKQCKEHWTCKLNQTMKRQPWTQEEDILLFKTIKQNSGIKKWVDMVKLFKGRTENAVKNRYNLIIEKEKKYLQTYFDELRLVDAYLQRCYVQKFTKIVEPDSQQQVQQFKTQKTLKIKPKRTKKNPNQKLQLLNSFIHTHINLDQKLKDTPSMPQDQKKITQSHEQMQKTDNYELNAQKIASKTNSHYININHRENDVQFDFTYLDSEMLH